MDKNRSMRIVAQSLPSGRRGRITVLAAGTASVLLFAMVTAFGTVPESSMPLTTLPVEQRLAPDIETISRTASSDEIFVHEEHVQRGDTVASILSRLGVDDAETRRLLSSSQATAPVRVLRPGASLQARTTRDGRLLGLWFIAGKDQLVTIQPQGDGFQAVQSEAELSGEETMKSGEIRSSLFAATDVAGIPDSIATQMADIFSGEIDFHRDLRKGDRFTVVYEMVMHQGQPVRAGRLLAAEFINQQRVLRAIWFQDKEKKGGYYTPEGKNLRKAFLRSPLEFSRVTSGFSMRFHPILKQWRAHKGIDYGAPSGTRVRATGSGSVAFMGRQSGYGNVVVLRHSGGMTTWYAHLRGFAKGMRVGTRVEQGDTIAYVGQTGWATGPHLHYEFRVNNAHRNPLTLALPAADPIPPARLGSFHTVTASLTQRLDLLRGTNIALLE